MLSLLLLQHALAPGSLDAHARSRLPLNSPDNPTTDVESRPYLRIAGILPLRIKSAPPPPDLISKPAAGAPPHPQNPAAASGAPASTPSLEPAGKPGDNTSAIQPAKLTPTPTPANTPPPPPILPDDTRPASRPEDFLPFFQFPGASQDVTGNSSARPPSPGQQTPSSASYQQK